MASVKVVDLFAGCGGLSIGFLQAGFKIVKAVEFDEMIAQTYRNNHTDVSVIVDDIRNIDTSNVFSEGDADVVIGGPPCQGFSMAGARIRNNFIDDPRNYLFKHYFNIVKTIKPKVFVMENVKGIETMQNGKIFSEIISLFKNKDLLNGSKYFIYHTVIKATDYGVPQTRERKIIIGVLNSNFDGDKIFEIVRDNIKKVNKTFFDKVSVWDAISNLSEIMPTTSGVVNNANPLTDYQKYLSSNEKQIYNHTSTKHSELAKNRMKKIAEGENFTKLRETIKSVHSGSYGRLGKNGFAPTITTRFDTPSGGKFTHPTYDRTLTPREAARIQSFPDDYIFYGNKGSICKQIGNAVPPKCAYFLAEVVKKILNDV